MNAPPASERTGPRGLLDRYSHLLSRDLPIVWSLRLDIPVLFLAVMVPLTWSQASSLNLRYDDRATAGAFAALGLVTSLLWLSRVGAAPKLPAAPALRGLPVFLVVQVVAFAFFTTPYGVALWTEGLGDDLGILVFVNLLVLAAISLGAAAYNQLVHGTRAALLGFAGTPIAVVLYGVLVATVEELIDSLLDWLLPGSRPAGRRLVEAVLVLGALPVVLTLAGLALRRRAIGNQLQAIALQYVVSFGYIFATLLIAQDLDFLNVERRFLASRYTQVGVASLGLALMLGVLQTTVAAQRGAGASLPRLPRIEVPILDQIAGFSSSLARRFPLAWQFRADLLVLLVAVLGALAAFATTPPDLAPLLEVTSGGDVPPSIAEKLDEAYRLYFGWPTRIAYFLGVVGLLIGVYWLYVASEVIRLPAAPRLRSVSDFVVLYAAGFLFFAIVLSSFEVASMALRVHWDQLVLEYPAHEFVQRGPDWPSWGGNFQTAGTIALFASGTAALGYLTRRFSLTDALASLLAAFTFGYAIELGRDVFLYSTHIHQVRTIVFGGLFVVTLVLGTSVIRRSWSLRTVYGPSMLGVPFLAYALTTWEYGVDVPTTWFGVLTTTAAIYLASGALMGLVALRPRGVLHPREP